MTKLTARLKVIRPTRPLHPEQPRVTDALRQRDDRNQLRAAGSLDAVEQTRIAQAGDHHSALQCLSFSEKCMLT
jgi:hypothetical protein